MKNILLPRGVRNNNPGNLRWGSDWQGLAPDKQRTDAAFCQFIEPVYGLRALFKVLFAYRKKPGQKGVGNEGIDTVREVISRFAPTNENNTETYIAEVCKVMGRKADDPLVFDNNITMLKLAYGIVRHENGAPPADRGPYWYPEELYADALQLARS